MKLSTKIRMLFGITTKEEKEALSKEVQNIKDIMEKICLESNKEQLDNAERLDSECPKCHGKKIVNKISNVVGHGEVSGSFALGFGSVYGRSHTDTTEVNHCSNCGNQWHKYKISFTHESNVVYDLSWTLKRILVEDENVSKYYSKEYDMMKHMSAESIQYVLNNYSNSVFIYTFSLTQLRTIFKSIYKDN